MKYVLLALTLFGSMAQADMIVKRNADNDPALDAHLVMFTGNQAERLLKAITFTHSSINIREERVSTLALSGDHSIVLQCIEGNEPSVCYVVQVPLLK